MSEAEDLERHVRRLVYERVVQTGRAPDVAEAAQALGRSAGAIEGAFQGLARRGVLALDAETGRIVLAPPFALVPTRVQVSAHGRTYWSPCVWCALGVPAMLGGPAAVETACGDCCAPISVQVRGGTLHGDDGIVHFAQPLARWLEDLTFT